MPLVKQIAYEDIDVVNSATCVPASQMYYMADTSPGELARHINEGTSPMQAIYEKVLLTDIAPDDPQKAIQTLKDNGIPYRMSGPGEVMVKIAIPEAGILRAVNASKLQLNGQYRSGVEALIQSAYAYLATKSYDPATDLTPVSLLARLPFVLAVHPSVPATTVMVPWAALRPSRRSRGALRSTSSVNGAPARVALWSTLASRWSPCPACRRRPAAVARSSPRLTRRYPQHANHPRARSRATTVSAVTTWTK